jgi:hypothetical protein
MAKEPELKIAIAIGLATIFFTLRFYPRSQDLSYSVKNWETYSANCFDSNWG